MPKPSARSPRAGSIAEDAVTGAGEPSTASVRPAPDNGVPYAEQPPQAPAAGPRQAVKRRGKQLNARIPVELYERLAAAAAGTRIPQGRLLERALDAELRSHGY